MAFYVFYDRKGSDTYGPESDTKTCQSTTVLNLGCEFLFSRVLNLGCIFQHCWALVAKFFSTCCHCSGIFWLTSMLQKSQKQICPMVFPTSINTPTSSAQGISRFEFRIRVEVGADGQLWVCYYKSSSIVLYYLYVYYTHVPYVCELMAQQLDEDLLNAHGVDDHSVTSKTEASLLCNKYTGLLIIKL